MSALTLCYLRERRVQRFRTIKGLGIEVLDLESRRRGVSLSRSRTEKEKKSSWGGSEALKYSYFKYYGISTFSILF